MNQAELDTVALDMLPGHCIRRLQQIAVAIFLQEAESSGLTPIQFAALQSVSLAPGADQRTLAARIGLDTSTVGGVIDRLEQRGLLSRQASEKDRRVRQLELTKAGRALLKQVMPAMLRAQARILAPLKGRDQAEFMRMLHILITANNELSRAPSQA